MTGCYPDQTQMRRNPLYLRDHLPNVQTMAQMFRNAGYVSTRIGKIFHYGVPAQIGTSGHDDPDSWDYFINPRGRDKDEEHLIFSLKPGEYGGYMSWLAAEGPDEEQTDGIAATEAAKLIQKYADENQPFFLAVGLYRPHTPYVAPKKYFDMYPVEKMHVPQVPNGYLETLPKPSQKSLTKKKEHYNISPDNARKAMQAYYAAISFADAQLGRILAALDKSGAADNTIIVFTSDHGYHMGEHGHWLKTTLFENAARVPLIIAGPGVTAAGERTQSLAEMVDFYPTLVELCGLQAPEFLSGVSLAPILKDPAVTVRNSAMTQLKNNYTIRTATHRYTEWGEEGSDGVELYDHRTDPQELVNVANSPDHAETVAKLSKVLRHRVADGRTPPPGLVQLGDDGGDAGGDSE